MCVIFQVGDGGMLYEYFLCVIYCFLSTYCILHSYCSLTAFWRFIGAIRAVDVMVTDKVLGDTLSVLAHELILGITSAVGVHWNVKRTRG